LLNDIYQIREVNVLEIKFWTKRTLVCDNLLCHIYFCVG
jgi:hypothetical protein